MKKSNVLTKDIQVLEFEDHIRKRTGMYLGSLGSSGMVNLIKGIIQDYLYLMHSENYFFNISIKSDLKFSMKIKTSLDTAGLTDLLLTHQENKFYLRICKTISKEFTLVKLHDEYVIKFVLNEGVFEESIDYFELYSELTLLAHLNRNLEIRISDNRFNYKNTNYINYPQGIKPIYDKTVSSNPIREDFEIQIDETYKGIVFQIFIGYSVQWNPEPLSITFANGVVLDGFDNSLVKGVFDGLINGCKKFATKNDLEQYKFKKKKFYNGLILVASVRKKDLQFDPITSVLKDDEIERTTAKLIQKEVISSLKKKCSYDFLERFDNSVLTSKLF